MQRVVIALGVVFWILTSRAAVRPEPIVIPVVRDPSPVIDGSLREWADRGVLRELNRAEQATYNPDGWKGVGDLSGWVRFGYDDQQLFVACHVVDDVFSQEQTGRDAWRGDHVMLTLDFVRSGKIGDLIQMGLSPGSLGSGDTLRGATRPELVIWRPDGYVGEGARVEARRTAEGYDIEAGIPWSVLKVAVVPYQTLALQLGLSDTDAVPNVQQKAVSISTAAWAPRDPERLTLAGLADRSGGFPSTAFDEAWVLAQALELKQHERRELVVDVARVPPGLVPTLTFKARIQHAQPSGCSGPLRLAINGKGMKASNIARRPAQMTAINGTTLSAWYGAGVRLWFGPSYEAIEAGPYKPLDVASYDYVLRFDGMFRQGRNTIELENVDKRPELVVMMDDVAFSWSPPSRFPKLAAPRPAPTGPLATVEPLRERRVDYEATPLAGGAIKVTWRGRELVLESRFSVPGGGWAELKAEDAPGWERSVGTAEDAGRGGMLVFSGVAPGLRLQRTCFAYEECILVRDTLTNTSDDADRALILAHHTAPGPYEALWLSGRPIPRSAGATSVPANPSIVVLGKDSGFAMMARDDVFRVHYRGTCNGEVAELADNGLVLRHGVTYQHEWLLFPLAEPDYWRFVNAARRHFGTNFTIPGSFCFYGVDAAPWKIVKEVGWAGAQYLSLGPQSYWKGMFAHGPFMRALDQSKVIAMHKAIKAVSPQTGRLQYFNCFNRSLAKQKEDPDAWGPSQARLPDGKQVTSGATLSFYFPTLDNEWGREMDELAEWMLRTVGADGLYWDCYDYSNVTHYGDPWDGWTADIDPGTHGITRRKSRLTLLSWPWREKWTGRLLKEGRPLVANGNPSLTSEYKYRFPRFVETASISAMSKTHLFTPIALGDHVTERNEVDSYRWMLRALDWGGLYYWYGIKPTRPSLTAYMFPFTPIELHSGYLIGEERILTKESGLFGWGDLSEFTAVVFNRIGRETDKVDVPRVTREGRAYAEVRIPEGYAVVILRAAK